MITAYIKHSLRRFSKGKTYTFLNIAGLTAGLSAALIIFLWIAHETAFDRQWEGNPIIYRLTEGINYNNGNVDDFALSGFPLGPSLQQSIPSISAYTRISYSGSPQLVWKEEQSYSVENLNYVDTNFLSFFPYPIVYGDATYALDAPEKAVLEKKTAQRIFGEINPIGQSLRISGKEFVVSAVYDAGAVKTHLDPDILLPNTNYTKEAVDSYNRDWTRMVNYTYIQFLSPPDMDLFRKQMLEWNEKVIGEWIKQHELTWSLGFKAQAVEDVHFTSNLQYDFPGNSNPKLIYIFGTIALFILLLASINYINLSTARAVKRARETGIRKLVGATRRSLIGLYISESIFLVFIAFGFSLVLAELLLPFFNRITGLDSLYISLFSTGQWIIIVSGIVLLGILSGFFPAFVLSSFKPSEAIKGGGAPVSGGQSGNLEGISRKVLVVFQFFVSTALIFSTLIVHSQMNHMKSHDPGFNQEHIMILQIPKDTTLIKKLPDMRTRFLQQSGIKNVSIAGHVPSRRPGRLTFYIDRNGQWEQQMMALYVVDHHYIDLLNIPLIDGRFFDERNKTDGESAIVLNEAAVKMLGWTENPLGRRLACGLGVDGKVVGVVKDFNYATLHAPIEPLAMLLLPSYKNFMLIKIDGANLKNTIANIQGEWQDFIGKYPLDYFFLNEDLMNGYQRDEQLFDIFSVFSILGLMISLLGLIGLIVYTAEQKTREIGIRKALGAKVCQIMLSISRSYLFWLFAGIILSWPISWYAMDQWLSDFAYHIDIQAIYFLLSGLISMLLSLIAVAIITYRAARSNPVNALRYE